MSHASISVIRFALDLGLKATLIFFATGAALFALRRSSAATRHFVGTFGLAAALLLPVLTLALPRFAVPLLPDVRPERESAAVEAPGNRESASRISRHRLALSVPEKPILAAADDVLEPAAPALAPQTPARIPWQALALAVWALGALAITARLAVGSLRISRIAREATRIVDPEWIEERESAARRLDLRQRVELLESSEVPVAVTSGLRRPLLLLGRVARLWEVERRRIVLLHELAHVRRGDWAALILAELAVALYWFHPVAWWLGRRVRRDAETACDDLVIATGTKPSVYAGHLLGIFRSLKSPAHPITPALAIARPHHFEERLRAILDPRVERAGHARPQASLYAAGLLTAAVAVAAVEPWKIPAAAATPPSAPVAKCEKAAPAARPARIAPVVASSETARAENEAQSDPEPPSAAEEPGRSFPAIWTASPESSPEIATGFMKASNGRRQPRDGSDWYARGMDLHNDERYTESVEAFQKAAEEGYREDAASYNVACGYALLGERDKAFEWLRRAMDAGFDVASYLGRDDDLDSLRSDPRWAEMKKLSREHKKTRERDKEKAVAARYERLVGRNPASGEPFFDIGIELLRADRYDLAVKAYQAAIDRGYRTGTALYNQACALSLAGDKDAALATLGRALEAGFDQPDTLRKDDDLDAIRDDPRFAALQREALELSLPGYHNSWWERGSRSNRARWREEATRFATYTQKHPQSGRGWFNLGYASLAADRPEDAAEAFRKALELGYRKPTTMYNLACSHARLDQKDAAFDWLFKALDAGFLEAGTLRSDDDLDNLRGDPRYRKALSIAKAKDREAEDEKD